MKILHIIDHMRIGGAQALLIDLVQVEKKYFAFALSPKGSENLQREHENFFISKSPNKLSFLSIVELKGLIDLHKIEIIHCHLWRSQVFGYLIKKFFLPKIKLIFHIHSRVENSFFGCLFLKISKKNVDQFIVVSKTTKKNLERCVGKSTKISILPNFVSKKFYKKSPKKHEHFFRKNKKITLGFVGRLHKDKGCNYLIKSLQFLEKTFSLRIIGDGPERKKLMKLTKELSLERRVYFVGSARDIVSEFSKINILVVPSISEPFGLVWAEGQALGIPIVASNVGGMRDFIKDGETGLLFEPKNIKDLKKKVLLLSNDASLRKKIISSSAQFIKNFTINNYLKELSYIYKKLK